MKHARKKKKKFVWCSQSRTHDPNVAKAARFSPGQLRRTCHQVLRTKEVAFKQHTQQQAHRVEPIQPNARQQASGMGKTNLDFFCHRPFYGYKNCLTLPFLRPPTELIQSSTARALCAGRRIRHRRHPASPQEG
ncbi:unnamed protein product [Ectocarpus fasciculatus]